MTPNVPTVTSVHHLHPYKVHLPSGIGTYSCAVSFHLGITQYCLAACTTSNHNLACIVPPGTHYCWVVRGSME